MSKVYLESGPDGSFILNIEYVTHDEENGRLRFHYARKELKKLSDVLVKALDKDSDFKEGSSEKLYEEPCEVTNNDERWSLREVQNLIYNGLNDKDRGKLRDGHHSFDELYEFRTVYNAGFFNSLPGSGILVEKSLRHHDGDYCFNSGGDWFIVIAYLPNGQVSNHYPKKDWDLFKNAKEVDRPSYPFDGHKPSDVLSRIKEFALCNGKFYYGKVTPESEHGDLVECPVCGMLGNYDKSSGSNQAFPKAVWYNYVLHQFECEECCLK